MVRLAHVTSGFVQVVVDMVVDRLQQEDAQKRGWLLDGYPRSGEQAEAIEAAGIRPDVFILINVGHLLISILLLYFHSVQLSIMVMQCEGI